MVLLAAPILLFTHNILTLWLGNHLPPYVIPLTQVIIFCSMLNAMAGSFWMSASAIGANVAKSYNITLAIINLFTMPLAYI